MTKQILTYERAHELFNYDEKTGDLIWKIDRNNITKSGDLVRKNAKSPNPDIRVGNITINKCRLIWLLKTKNLPKGFICHRDGNKRNHSWNNLVDSGDSGQELTAERAKEIFYYDKETGILKRKTGGFLEYKYGDKVGAYNSNGYLITAVCNSTYRVHRIIWLIETGSFPKGSIDHINGVRDDNRWENLREVTVLENNKNSRKSKVNTSGFVGVYKYSQAGKWRAAITINNKSKHLGVFDNKEDAIKARKSANKKYGFHENHGK